jgi:hypothetical protein
VKSTEGGKHGIAEKKVREQLEAEGAQVYRCGWPDLFVVTKEGKPRLIEVKGKTYNGKEELYPNQKRMHALLREHFGIEVEVIHVYYERASEKEIREFNKLEAYAWSHGGLLPETKENV